MKRFTRSVTLFALLILLHAIAFDTFMKRMNLLGVK